MVLFLQRLASWIHQDPSGIPFQAGTPPYAATGDTCMSGFGFAVRKGNYLMLSRCSLQLLLLFFLVFLKFPSLSFHTSPSSSCDPCVH